MTTSEPLVVDASVGVKWLFDEEQFELARALASDAARARTPILVPPHFHFEVLNAAWRKVARGLVSPDEGGEAITEITNYHTITVAPAMLSNRAYELALRLPVRPGAIYDLLYVALAQIVGCTLWTADSKLANAVAGVPVVVSLLSTYTPQTA